MVFNFTWVVFIKKFKTIYQFTSSQLSEVDEFIKNLDEAIEKLNYLITLNFSFGIFCLIILLGAGRSNLPIKKIIITNINYNTILLVFSII